jgi:hypothetical protein
MKAIHSQKSEFMSMPATPPCFCIGNSLLGPESRSKMTSSLNHAVRDVLEQGSMFLDQLNEEEYGRALAGTFKGSLGAHYRHILDHFLCLFRGIRSGEVNYDQRKRDTLLETSLLHARIATEELIAEFSELDEELVARPCVVTYSVGYGAAGAGSVISNVGREIMFCVGHAIHHYAILKLLAASARVTLPSVFGVAPSTLKHRESVARD